LLSQDYSNLTCPYKSEVAFNANYNFYRPGKTAEQGAAKT
jgi:hypothetical protein